MTPNRLEEIQKATAYPDSASVRLALATVRHETQLANEEKIQALELEIQRLENLVLGRDIDGVLIPGKPLRQL